MCWMGARSRPGEIFLFICTQNNSCLSPNIYFLPHSHGIWKHLQFFPVCWQQLSLAQHFLEFLKAAECVNSVTSRGSLQTVLPVCNSQIFLCSTQNMANFFASSYRQYLEFGWLVGVFFTHFSLMFLRFHFPEMRALCSSKAHARIYFSSLTLSKPDAIAVSWATLIGRIISILWKTLVYQARQRWWQLHSL